MGRPEALAALLFILRQPPVSANDALVAGFGNRQPSLLLLSHDVDGLAELGSGTSPAQIIKLRETRLKGAQNNLRIGEQSARC
jgi:hypothetical protein